VKRFLILFAVVVCMTQFSCSPSPRSDKSFDEIRKMVSGKTEAEVEKLLGAPDHYEKLLFGDERWTWWNYTHLGKGWKPEVRDKIIHLEITFAAPLLAAAGQEERSRWRVSEPYGVGFSFAGDEGGTPPSSLNKNTRSGI
jgi:hypothetical protein